MAEFNEVTTSDHCGFFIDLTQNVLLKGKTTTILSPFERQLQSKSPKWKPWYHQKFGLINGTLYDGMKDGNYFVPIPVNILTVNRLFGLNIKTEDQMND